MNRTNSSRSRTAGSRPGRNGVKAGLTIPAYVIALLCFTLPGCPEDCDPGKTLNQAAEKKCIVCDGTGKRECDICKNQNQYYETPNQVRFGKNCTKCSGTGKLNCLVCEGSGKLLNKLAPGK